MLLFDHDLSVNKMIEDILNSETMNISDHLEQIWNEELKEDDYSIGMPMNKNDSSARKKNKYSFVQLASDYDDEITIKPNFEVYWSKSPASRRQSKTHKYLNKCKQSPRQPSKYTFKGQLIEGSKDTSSNMITIDWLKLSPNLKLKIPENKIRTTRSKVMVKSNIKAKKRVATQIEKLINEFYSQISVQGNKEKLLSLFKTEGRGAIIEIEDNPIFPLKLTLEFLVDRFKNHKVIVNKIQVENTTEIDEGTPRTAFKEAQNSNQLSNLSNNSSNILNVARYDHSYDNDSDQNENKSASKSKSKIHSFLIDSVLFSNLWW